MHNPNQKAQKKKRQGKKKERNTRGITDGKNKQPAFGSSERTDARILHATTG
jgi:hypothetical protein